MDSKGARVDDTGVSSPTTSSISGDHVKDPDQAYTFLKQLGEKDGRHSEVSIKAIRRKVDWRIVPIMFLCYTMQFIDKVSLNYAAVMGLVPELKLRGNDFTNAATAFFIAYLVTEVPTAYILNKVPPGKYLGINVVLWGIATACTAACHNYSSLLAARIFLGIFEAAIAPCLMLISSQWYTKAEQAPRFSFWYCGLGIGQILGGIISYGFQQVTHTSFAGWRIMFVFLGVLTVIIGTIAFFFLPDSPMKARFLTDDEKAAVLHHTAENQTGIQNTHFKLAHIWEALLDVQLWLMTLITILISISSGVVTTYSATLIRNIGYKPDSAALLNMPSGIVSIVATLGVGIGVRYIGAGHRWFWLVLCCVPGILGGGLMSFLPSGKTNANKAGLLAGVYLVNSVVATLIVLYQWTASNVAGHTKRVFSVSLIAGAFSVGNIIGPQTFQAKDAPQFIPAKITVLATQSAGALMAFVLFLYYRWANAAKDKKMSQVAGSERGQWDNLTDKENPTFRYVY
ncbi:uncharacterized protein HMPREF1541_10193 [Cyphellophora europaea CBS 101466]|uniref:Major facilitator superfamily (MFS) profile domain-containing protein n=1 Tax=Cyphellophora europaea (strain CBS 101466) TaxID=1220924 RepID=W2S920_CYPE1|nr:uncharacterized protein HMPREF1541_10193 [Cyphellophora europaea CBS 101466]ETN44523.1 hypothetical protein HMPREF1541_10193 [Cyphellophora europaea CBS 101466]